MKPVVKFILGALGFCAVGKLAYEVGRDVGSIETQLQYSMKQGNSEETKTETETTEEKPQPKTVLGKKLAELKSIAKIKELFTRGDDTTIGKLLRNPDGAQIEASVVDGEVHISVKPRPPKRESETRR